MSAVSSESPLAAADFSAPSANPSSSAQPGESAEPGTAPGSADFGANEWLVDELYQRYLDDPGSVDKAWWSFFADYRPFRGGANGTGPQPVLTGPALTGPAAPAAPAPPAQAQPAEPAPAAPTAPAAQPQPAPSQAGQPAAAPPADADLSKLRG